ncbi:MAG: hypothetical protein U0163_09585, partial [Gemmatimonadaceae bacterium]
APAALATLILANAGLAAQSWQTVSSGSTASLRGLAVVSDQVVWASGSRGTVLRSVDGGTTWAVDAVPGARSLEIRAISAANERVAHVAATAGRIWRTVDGGQTWSLQYQAADTSVFLDAIGFWDERHGIAMGDPLDGRFFLLATNDGGDTWHEVQAASRPAVSPGETAFAASGTSLVLLQGGGALIGSGGSVARVHRSKERGAQWSVSDVPVRSGERSNGVFSLAVAGSAVIAVGGDYRRPDSTRAVAARSSDGGATWTPARTMPSGYRSGAALTSRGLALAVGTNGTDLSLDGGVTWTAVDRANYNAVQIAPGGMAFAVGPSGAIARLDTRLLSTKR